MLLVIATIFILTLSLYFTARDLPHVIITENKVSCMDYMGLIFPILILAGFAVGDAAILYKDCPSKANYPEDLMEFTDIMKFGSSLGSLNSPARKCYNQALKIVWLWIIRWAYMVEQIDNQGRISPKVKLLIVKLAKTMIIVY